MQRIAKVIASAGLCSRRQAENLINEGRVTVNNTVINSPALNIDDKAIINVDGKALDIAPKQVRLWTYYKPCGLIVTHSDTHTRTTIFEQLTALPRVVSIGRLDLNSEGLLLLTNNGDLARTYELPANKFIRIYKVRVFGDISNWRDYRNNYLYIDGIRYNFQEIKLIRKGQSNSWFEVTLFEGKNREIRRIFEQLGLKVNKLIRIQYGKYKLEDLSPGQYREQEI